MFNISIEITGPGQCFDSEYYLLLRTLEQAGYIVEQKNEYPNLELKETKSKKPKILLVANHMPWGG